MCIIDVGIENIFWVWWHVAVCTISILLTAWIHGEDYIPEFQPILCIIRLFYNQNLKNFDNCLKIT